MAINKDKEMIIPVILPKEIEKVLKEVSKKNNRSRSAQVLTYIQQGLERETQ